jgi:hypothetical protein
MKRKRVVSSNVASVGYKVKSGTMEIRFKRHAPGAVSRIYQYESVPRQVYEGMMKAESKGKYFHAQVRGRFDHRRVR